MRTGDGAITGVYGVSCLHPKAEGGQSLVGKGILYVLGQADGMVQLGMLIKNGDNVTLPEALAVVMRRTVASFRGRKQERSKIQCAAGTRQPVGAAA